MIGVTGTNGKTTVTFLIRHILKTLDESYGVIGTIEYSSGKRSTQATNTTPDTLEIQRLLAEMIENGLDGCVMEVSSHGLDQHRCDDIEYKAAIFTNLTQDHLDYHKNYDDYFKAKSILFTRLLKKDGLAILNANDPYAMKLKDMCQAKSITYQAIINGHQDKIADLIVSDQGYKNNRRNFKVEYNGIELDGCMPYLGKFNLANAAAAIATLAGLGYDLKSVVEALANAPQVPGRVEKIEAGQPFGVIIDYAHTPDALENLLTGVDTEGRKIVAFGCGGDRDKTKRPIMGQIAAKYADVLFVTSDNPRTEDPKRIISDIIKGIPDQVKYKVIEKRDEAIGQAINEAKPGDLVIIAGKGHEDYQVVGNARYYFSDPKVVMTYLKKLGYAGT
jgi:UDP-N-acetylmuramoyl-L-alanyl-D-glutamate--2,6-diaminopimelate ligase